METTGNRDFDDEIDLRELALSVWSGRKMIVGVALVCLVLSMAFAFARPDRYTATATFEYSGATAVAARIMSKSFIAGLAAEHALYDDPDFYPVDKDGIVTAAQSLLGLRSRDRIPVEFLAERYRTLVSVSKGREGPFSLTVTHSRGARAAELANAIVAKLTAGLSEDARRKELWRLEQELTQVAATARSARAAVQMFMDRRAAGADGADTRTADGSEATILAEMERHALIAQGTEAALSARIAALATAAIDPSELPTVLQSATEPDRPSGRNGALIVLGATVFGAVAGIVWAITSSTWKGLLHSNRAIGDATGARLRLTLTRAELARAGKADGAGTPADLPTAGAWVDLLVAIATRNPKVILIAATSDALSPLDLATALAHWSDRQGIASEVVGLGIDDTSPDPGAGLAMAADAKGMKRANHGLQGMNPSDILTSGLVERRLSADTSPGRIILATKRAYSAAACHSNLGGDVFTVLLSAPGMTRRSDIAHMVSRHRPDVSIIMS